jgi:hypothetical protein
MILHATCLGYPLFTMVKALELKGWIFIRKGCFVEVTAASAKAWRGYNEMTTPPA